MARLTPYGSADQVQNVAKVGKKKTSRSLAVRMPSPDIAAKVGQSLVTVGNGRLRVVRLGASN
jgi:hypothetical protein